MSFWSKLRSLGLKAKLEAEMAEEMRQHVELQTELNCKAGMSLDEARYAALRQFGNVAVIQEQAREVRGWRWLADIFQDLGYGWRQLRRNPGFTAVAVFTLALGIGVNSTTLSFVNDLIVRPAVRNRQGNLVALHTARVGAGRSFRPFSHAEYTLLREASDTFSDLAAMQFNFSAVGRAEDVRRRLLCLVSQNYFSVLGITPLRGRFFTAEETRPNADLPVVVASYNYWREMGGREDFIGSQIQINGRNCTVVGITPAGFGGIHWSLGPSAWLPLGMSSSLAGGWGYSVVNDLLDLRSFRLDLFGSLRPGLTLAAANNAVAPLSARLNEQSAARSSETRELILTEPARFDLSLSGIQDESGVRIYAVAALSMTVTVLLVACLNVANMLFSRGVSRQKEIAIRLSLGASRWRVVRQLLVEGLLLALAGGAVGLLLSRWSNALVIDAAGQHGGALVLHLSTALDWPLVAATFGLCLFATVVFSLVPALRATRLNLMEDLKQQAGEPSGNGRWGRFFSFRHCVVITQIALSLMLLFSTGLLLRAVAGLEHDRGFEADNQVIANLDYHLAGTPTAEVPVRQRALLVHAAALPGVAQVALASTVPYGFETYWSQVFAIGAGTAGQSTDHQGNGGHYGATTIVSNAYFATMGIPLLRGRDFTEAEGRQAGGPRVAIIDESLGRSLFADQDPVGRHIALEQAEADGQHAQKEIEIVGVVHSPRNDPFQSAQDLPRLYRPLGQSEITNTYLHVKLAQSSAIPDLISPLRRELHALDPATPLLICEPLTDLIGSNMNVWSVRFLAILFTLFGVIAVTLAVVGVYGVKAYVVARRTHEIGIRIAIGARPADVLVLLLKQGVLQTAVGLAGGLVLAVIAGLGLARMLYRINPTDPWLLLGAATIVALVSILACLVPALRATRVNPTEALRAE